ncbi:MAG: hypothetical protein ACE5JD_18115, partial [Candidatus Methylomirabilia bacterium]
KLVLEVPGEDLLLFDLTSDPAELDNVASRQPALAQRLRRQLLEHLAALARREPLSRQTAPISDAVRERLRALGYVR